MTRALPTTFADHAGFLECFSRIANLSHVFQRVDTYFAQFGTTYQSCHDPLHRKFGRTNANLCGGTLGIPYQDRRRLKHHYQSTRWANGLASSLHLVGTGNGSREGPSSSGIASISRYGFASSVVGQPGLVLGHGLGRGYIVTRLP